MGDLGVIIFGAFIFVFLYLIGIFILWRAISKYSKKHLRPLLWIYHLWIAIWIIIGFKYLVPYKAFLFANLIYFVSWLFFNKDRHIQKRLLLIVMLLIPFYILNIVGFDYWDMRFSKDDNFFKTKAKREFAMHLLALDSNRYLDKNSTLCNDKLLQKDFDKRYEDITIYLSKHPTYMSIKRANNELPFISHEKVEVSISYPISKTDKSISLLSQDGNFTLKNQLIHFKRLYNIREVQTNYIKPLNECYVKGENL